MPSVPRPTGTNIALVAVFAALIVALTLPPEFPLASGVPITLQTLGVVLAGLVLGAWRGAAAAALYVLAGLAGLPIFADGAAGSGVVTGPTGGYLWSFPIAAFVVGWVAERLRARNAATLAGLVGAGLASLPIVYAIGVPWLAYKLQVPVLTAAEQDGPTALAWGMTPFIVGDLIKVALAATVAAAIHRAYPSLLPVRAARGVEAEPKQKVTVSAES